jgi:hypothetical protein
MNSEESSIKHLEAAVQRMTEALEAERGRVTALLEQGDRLQREREEAAARVARLEARLETEQELRDRIQAELDERRSQSAATTRWAKEELMRLGRVASQEAGSSQPTESNPLTQREDAGVPLSQARENREATSSARIDSEVHDAELWLFKRRD